MTTRRGNRRAALEARALPGRATGKILQAAGGLEPEIPCMIEWRHAKGDWRVDMATTESRVNAFSGLLAAEGRSAEIPEASDVYGWLAGSWDLEVLRYRGLDVSTRGLGGEAHFRWVLEGRAVQDVWIMPRVSQRGPDPDRDMNMYGTTLRVWDAAIQAWRITWINPVRGHREEQIGRRIGQEIVQVGSRANGTPTRWRFTEITPDSFHWLGEALDPDGTTWKLEGEFRARRVR